MAFLIIEQNGAQRRGTLLNGRALIGRWPTNEIVIDDPDVSRVHAWIVHANGRCVITDSRSRSGTRVNGRKLGQKRYTLNDGDAIGIGQCTLRFGAGDALPADVEPLAPPTRDVRSPRHDAKGMRFDCVCQAPLWAPRALAGQPKQCRYCRQHILIPFEPGATAQLATARPAASPAAAEPTQRACNICQWSIDASDETAHCPDCELTFHTECWSENLGCSSYGCKKVNALAPKLDKPVDEAADVVEVQQPASGAVARDSLLLPTSVMASLLGVLLFGLPAFLAGGAIALYVMRNKNAPQRGVMPALALAVAIVGAVAGAAVSCWWWLDTWS